MNPKLTAQLFHADEPTRFVLMAGDHIFASPFVVSDPTQAHKLAEAWNAYEAPTKQPALPMDELRRACSEMLQNHDVKPRTAAGKRLITAFWTGVLQLQQALGHTPHAGVVICLVTGRHDDLISKE